MNRKELIKAGIPEHIIDEADINVSSMVTSDEFRRLSHTGKSYRDAAVERLIKMAVPFHIETNIVTELVTKLVTVTCPYCKNKMHYHGGSGSGVEMGCDFMCHHCESAVALRFNCYSGIYVRPSGKAERKMKKGAKRK